MTKPILVIKIPHDTEDRAFKGLQTAIKNIGIESQYYIFIIKLLSTTEIVFETYNVENVPEIKFDELREKFEYKHDYSISEHHIFKISEDLGNFILNLEKENEVIYQL